MKITKLSPLTGRLNTMDIEVTQEQLDELNTPSRVRLVQDILPGLNAAEREFLKTGYTQSDWDLMFPPEEGPS